VINATATVRDFRLVRHGADLEVRDITGVPSGFPGTVFFSTSYASFGSLTIHGTTAESNRVVLDFGGSRPPLPNSNATPIPAGGPPFDGKSINDGPVAGPDQLAAGSPSAVGAPAPVMFGNVAVTYTDAASGSTTFTDTTPTSLGTASFSNLDGLDLSGGSLSGFAGSVAIQNLTFTLPAGAIPATFLDTGTATDGVSRLQTTAANPTAFVATNFANPSNPLAAHPSAPGNDTVALAGMDNGFAPALLNFTGNTTGDVFRLTSANFFQSPVPGVTLTSATLDLNGISDTVAWIQDVPGASTLALSSGAILTTGDASSHAYNGLITGNGGLIKTGSGDFTIGGTLSNTFTGPTTVNGGRLLLNKVGGGSVAVSGNLVVGDDLSGDDSDVVRWLAGNQLLPSSQVRVNASGLLDLNNFNNTIVALTLESGSTVAAT